MKLVKLRGPQNEQIFCGCIIYKVCYADPYGDIRFYYLLAKTSKQHIICIGEFKASVAEGRDAGLRETGLPPIELHV